MDFKKKIRITKGPDTTEAWCTECNKNWCHHMNLYTDSKNFGWRRYLKFDDAMSFRSYYQTQYNLDESEYVGAGWYTDRLEPINMVITKLQAERAELEAFVQKLEDLLNSPFETSQRRA